MVRIRISSRFRLKAITERLLDWREEAARSGRRCRADRLLLLAWRAYDQPLVQPSPPQTEADTPLHAVSPVTQDPESSELTIS